MEVQKVTWWLSRRFDQTLGESLVRVETAGFPRVEGFIGMRLALDHARVVTGARTELYVAQRRPLSFLVVGCAAG